MEIKDTLEKPYTDIQRVDFIVSNNHQKGYEIRETETELQAWGMDINDLFILTKSNKYVENDKKANEARYNQEFTLVVQEQECLFDTTEQTQRDLLTAFAVCSTGETYNGWVTNNGVELDLTLQDVVMISSVFKEKSDVYGKWNEYKTAIDEAKTLEELEEIEIDYDKMDNE